MTLYGSLFARGIWMREIDQGLAQAFQSRKQQELGSIIRGNRLEDVIPMLTIPGPDFTERCHDTVWVPAGYTNHPVFSGFRSIIVSRASSLSLFDPITRFASQCPNSAQSSTLDGRSSILLPRIRLFLRTRVFLGERRSFSGGLMFLILRSPRSA